MQCKQFIDTKLSDYIDEDNKFFKFCDNSGHYVTELKEGQTNNIYPFCIYMIYWIYREVLSKNAGKYIGLVKEFFGSVTNLEDCKIFVDEIDQDIYEKLKTLYDLYDDFFKFKSESLTNDSATCKNGTKCVDLYKKQVDYCKINYNDDFCAKLIDFKKEYEKHMETLTNCGNMPRYLPSIGSNIATSVSIPVVAMSLISFISFISYKVLNIFFQN
ncbi:hypothetical protein PVNG_05953 [Plasmodium vivax North Korean]|uniref:Variable surface protein Vir7-like protein n=1 Tax=Plasmodium vivax North Korean TaxID=1035514 RepID=A0A0J9W706_PLAVI|nr:hypothetical protein PVNG_05953 [Plasmodium vivax North Korean]